MERLTKIKQKRRRQRKTQAEIDDPDILDSEWDASMARVRKRAAEEAHRSKDASPDYRRQLFARLCDTVFDVKELKSHRLRVALATDEACDEVEHLSLFTRINTHTATLHSYIAGVTRWRGGTFMQRCVHASTDWSGLAITIPLSCQDVIKLWQGEYGLTFAAIILPVYDLPRRGYALFVFEWQDVAKKGDPVASAGSASDVVAVGVMVRFTPESLEACMGEFEALPLNSPLSAFSPVCEVIPRAWLVTDGDQGTDVAALKSLEFPATGCSFESVECLRAKGRFHYQTTCLIDPDLAALQQTTESVMKKPDLFK